MRRLLLCAMFLLAAVPAQAFHPEFVQKTAVTYGGMRALHAADFNGDGYADVVMRGSGGYAWLLPGRSDGTFDKEVAILASNFFISSSEIGDLNADGRVDVVFADVATNAIIVLLGEGNGTFRPPVLTQLADPPTNIAIGNFDGDGVPDLVFRSFATSSFTVMRGSGTGSFSVISRHGLSGDVAASAVADFDRNGRDDIVFAKKASLVDEVYFTNMNDSLDGPVTIPAAPHEATVLKVADLDLDGDPDLISGEFSGNSVTVTLNAGNRTWNVPTSYRVVPSSVTEGNPNDLLIADVTGDEVPDVVATLPNYGSIGVLQGSGGGVLAPVVYTPVRATTSSTFGAPITIAAGDVDGDDRLDLVVSTSNAQRGVLPFKNVSGEVAVTVTPIAPVITNGQTAEVTIDVTKFTGVDYVYSYPPPTPTGNVVMTEGSDVIGRATLVQGSASISIAALPPGSHALTVSYEGDSNYRAGASGTATQTVTSARTYVVVRSSTDGAGVAYGQNFTISWTTTSDIAGTPTGRFNVYVDGALKFSKGTETSATIYGEDLTPGTHSFRVDYVGSATHPPGSSNVLEQTISKSPTTTTLEYVDSTHVRPTVHGRYYAPATPSVKIYDWNAVIAEGTSWNVVSIPLLSAGTHYLRAVYAGDDYSEASTSAAMPFSVDQAFRLYATAGAQSIAVWTSGPPTGTASYRIERRVGTGPWSVVSDYAVEGTLTETNPSPGVPYTYRISAMSSSRQALAISNADTAMLLAFADDPLVPGMVARSLHLTELLSATNALRSAVGLGPINLAAASGQTIRASHFAALYGAINEARGALGSTPVPIPAEIAVGGVLRMQHLQDLREALR